MSDFIQPETKNVEMKDKKYSVDKIIEQVDKIKKGEVTRYAPVLYYGAKRTADRICAKLIENGLECKVEKSDTLNENYAREWIIKFKNIRREFTKKQWIEALTADVTIELWGDEYTFKPVICTKQLGDGEKLVRIAPIGQRPYYWMMFVDSEMDVSHDMENEDLEKLIQMAEDEFGVHPYTQGLDFDNKEEFDELRDGATLYGYTTWQDYLDCCEYPHIYWDGGSWSTIANFKTGEYDDYYLKKVEEYFNNELK